jgi:hypothetical protein
MIIQEEIRGADNTLVVCKGQEVTPALVLKLKNLRARHVIAGEVTVSMPMSTLAFVKGTA